MKKWVATGELAVLGVIQEQHPERCVLFSQWQEFDWPILHDPINVLRTTAVPILVAIDEHGIVRSTKPKVETFEEEFMSVRFAPPSQATAPESLTPSRDSSELRRTAEVSGAADDWRSYADSVSIWGDADSVDHAIQAYERVVKADPQDAPAQFRLGVCLRRRYETPSRQADDFSRAVGAWENALAQDPNQYIWRRRIQQYGPRLMKPYPFYDWVTQAEQEITARGLQPVHLAVRPTGAEIAEPSKEFAVARSTAAEANAALIFRDVQQLIRTSVTVVPTEVKPGSTARVHVEFVPNVALKSHWNNEAEPLRMWVAPSEVQASAQHLASDPVEEAVSDEVRRLDFEVQVPADAAPESTLSLSAYALYYVCEDVDGQCRFLRGDIPIEIAVAPAE